jgi:hypothetical protein
MKIFPYVLIVLNMGAAIVYYLHGDYRRGTYWLAATVLNICITL